jgi:hypothetical protein
VTYLAGRQLLQRLRRHDGTSLKIINPAVLQLRFEVHNNFSITCRRLKSVVARTFRALPHQARFPSINHSRVLYPRLNSPNMTDKLPPNLLALFAPRPPLRWVPPSDHAPQDRKTAPISGVAAFLPQLQEYKENDDYVPTESWLQRRDRIRLEKQERHEQNMKEAPTLCKDYAPPHLIC